MDCFDSSIFVELVNNLTPCESGYSSSLHFCLYVVNKAHFPLTSTNNVKYIRKKLSGFCTVIDRKEVEAKSKDPDKNHSSKVWVSISKLDSLT